MGKVKILEQSTRSSCCSFARRQALHIMLYKECVIAACDKIQYQAGMGKRSGRMSRITLMQFAMLDVKVMKLSWEPSSLDHSMG